MEEQIYNNSIINLISDDEIENEIEEYNLNSYDNIKKIKDTSEANQSLNSAKHIPESQNQESNRKLQKYQIGDIVEVKFKSWYKSHYGKIIKYLPVDEFECISDTSSFLSLSTNTNLASNGSPVNASVIVPFKIVIGFETAFVCTAPANCLVLLEVVVLVSRVTAATIFSGGGIVIT